MSSLHGFGLGIVSENAQGAVLDTFYPRPVAQVSDEVSFAQALLDEEAVFVLPGSCFGIKNFVRIFQSNF